MDLLSKLLYSACALALLGCGDGGANESEQGLRSVVQGGPQDIGEYRAIVAAGKVPALSVLEETGFFAEHKIDLPPADCGASICIHPMLAVAPRFDGGNWTMAFVGMNTAVDPGTLPTKPRHVVLVLGSETTARRDIVPILAAGLTPEDRVSVLSSRGLETPEQGILPGQLTLSMVSPPSWMSPISLYSALSDALALVRRPGFADYAGRVLLFPNGFLDSGLEPQHFADLALEFARQETPISVFHEPSSRATGSAAPAQPTGYGQSPEPVAPSSGYEAALADLTSGNYYAANNATDLTQAVAVETATGFLPLARNLELTVTAAPGYRIGRVYGAPNARVDGVSAVLSSPVSYVGARSASSDTQTGRRGGGGGWFVQLLADGPATGTPYSPADAFTLDTAYDDAVTGARVTGTQPLQTPLGVGQNPPPEQPYFSDSERGKPFMMLNMYLALATTTTLANQNECGSARAIEPMMRDAWQIFSQLFPDTDIDADFDLLSALTRNIEQTCREPIPQILDVPMSCGYF